MIGTPDAPARPRPLPRKPAGRRALLAHVPVPLTPLIAREQETALATALLRSNTVRLLTLTGPGGVGKTRLAIQVATELAERSAFADGVRYVPLAAVPDAGLVAPTIARAFGLAEAGDILVRDTLVTALRDAEMLLLLDNFEHVVAAVPLLADLLAACPLLKILTTSRALLRAAGEAALPVPPLDLPDPKASPSLEYVERSAAARLFIARAQAVVPSIELTAFTAPLIADICRRLDGLPLAIELAAARVNLLPLPALRGRLEQRLPLLAGGLRDAPRRHQTMRDAIAWSCDLLGRDEQRLFRALGVFAGAFGLPAAEYVAGGGLAPFEQSGSPSVLDGLAALIDRSLLLSAPDAAGQPRFQMLETIREYAVEQLRADGEDAGASHRHAEFYAAMAERFTLAAITSDREHILAALEAELPNLRTALAWFERSGDAVGLVQLSGALHPLWLSGDRYAEGLRWLDAALARGADARQPILARAMVSAGALRIAVGDAGEAAHRLDEALAIAREAGEPVWAALALCYLGVVANMLGDYPVAATRFEEALRQADSISSPSVAQGVIRQILANLGVALQGMGRLAEATARYEEALRLEQELGNNPHISYINLGDAARDGEDHAVAFGHYRHALDLARSAGVGQLRTFVECLAGCACVAAAWGDANTAGRLLGAADALRERLGLSLFLPTDRAAVGRAVETAISLIGSAGLEAARATGRSLTIEDAIALAEGIAPPGHRPAVVAPAATPFGLSQRETEVLRLLADGRIDREIADALSISCRTAEGHVARLLTKLSVPTRTAAVAAAISAGLVGLPKAEASPRA